MTPQERRLQRNANNRQERRFFLKLKLCPKCRGRNRIVDSHKLCPECLAKNRDINWQRTRTRMEQGQCPRCGQPMDRQGMYCNSCLAKRRAYMKHRKEWRVTWI